VPEVPPAAGAEERAEPVQCLCRAATAIRKRADLYCGEKMKDKRCGTCAFFLPAFNEKTGRVRPSEPGRCNYKVDWPVLPASYYSISFRGYHLPVSHHVYRGSCRECRTWQEKEKKPKEKQQVMDL